MKAEKNGELIFFFCFIFGKLIIRNVFVRSQNWPPSKSHTLVISKEETAALRKECDSYRHSENSQKL